MDKVTLSFGFLIAFIVYSWWTTTPEEAEETNVPVFLLIAIGMFCFEGLWCGLDFFRQRCFGATLGSAFFAHIVIVLIKRNQITTK
jgi:ribose/xylose/arabinose/galactoside ABC-type transport system permease subunit